MLYIKLGRGRDVPDNRLKDFFLQAVELQQAKEYDAAIKNMASNNYFPPRLHPRIK